MKSITLIFFLGIELYFIQPVMSQFNIVGNSGFETITGCPSASGQWNLCAGWNNVNMLPGVGLYGSPDFYHSCGTNQTAPPNTYAGNCPTHLGFGMMSLVMYNTAYPNYREYLARPLSCNMFAGTTYTVSFWISNGTTNISPWTIRNIGVHFSNGPLSQSGYGVINVIPQCEVTSNIATQNWANYTFAITPTATCNYLTIGSFRQDSQNNPVLGWPNPGGNPSAYANYFIDDIEVLSPAASTIQVQVSPAGAVCAGSTVTLTAIPGGAYNWSNGSTSNAITLTVNTTTMISVQGSNTAQCSLGVQTGSAQIIVNPSPVLSISANPSVICSGQTSMLIVTGANSYVWSNGSTFNTATVAPLIPTTYSVVGTIGNCWSVGMVTVGISPAPVLSIQPPKEICAGAQVTLAVSGANTYTWSNQQTGSVIAVSAPSVTYYSVTGTSAAGCTNTAGTFLFVQPCTGMVGESENFSIEIFPTLIENDILIRSYQGQFELICIAYTGELIFKKSIEIKANGEMSISLSNLSPGLFYLFVQGSSVNKLFKLVKL